MGGREGNERYDEFHFLEEKPISWNLGLAESTAVNKIKVTENNFKRLKEEENNKNRKNLGFQSLSPTCFFYSFYLSQFSTNVVLDASKFTNCSSELRCKWWTVLNTCLHIPQKETFSTISYIIICGTDIITTRILVSSNCQLVTQYLIFLWSLFIMNLNWICRSITQLT